MVLSQHQLRVVETLAQEINNILGGQLEACALSVLHEMLVCREPQDVALVLEENNMALVGAAPEAKKRLREEAVAEEAPWKDPSLAVSRSLCDVRRPKVWLELQVQYKPVSAAQHHAQGGHGFWLRSEELMVLTPSIVGCVRPR